MMDTARKPIVSKSGRLKTQEKLHMAVSVVPQPCISHPFHLNNIFEAGNH